MKTWRAWITYLRLPNVLSVPGDVLLGAALADAVDWSLLPRLAAVCLAYLFGMALNDLLDLPEDLRERPERPLPSGAIPLSAARMASVLLACAAFAFHPSPALGLLLFTCCTYTLLKSRFPCVGAFLMGLCRALAVWIGAGSVLPPTPPLAWALLQWGLFIFLVTRIASFEAGGKRTSKLPLAIPLLFCITQTGWLFLAETRSLLSMAAMAPLVFACLQIRGIRQRKWKIRPQDIGALLGLLYWMQFSVLLLSGHTLLAVLVLVFGRIQRHLRRSIPAS